MTWVRCPTCRARRPHSMPQCPVCDGRAGAPPRFDEIERRERAAWDRVHLQLFLAEVGVVLILALVTWLLRGDG
jgi:hypothetical protein